MALTPLAPTPDPFLRGRGAYSIGSLVAGIAQVAITTTLGAVWLFAPMGLSACGSSAACDGAIDAWRWVGAALLANLVTGIALIQAAPGRAHGAPRRRLARHSVVALLALAAACTWFALAAP